MELEDVSFQFLREITDGFSENRILGEGAFGVVYKGVTKNGDDVAVKRLKLRDVNLDFKQFQNEFYNLTKLKHQNIVQILGYCYETEKKPFIMPDGSNVFVDETYTAFCFEYLQNGNLQKHLCDEFCELDWHRKFKIIKGTCEGLKYIHEERIYHLDLKPDNILLDKNMMPKISDFGLSRIFGEELARISRHPYGTPGYQPPEYIDKGEISGKFDIFSLGVVIIKIVSGPKGYPKCLDLSSDEFIDQVRRYWRNRLEATCTGDSLEAYCHQVETCAQIALNCVETDSQKRPDIIKITEKLNDLECDTGKLPEKGCHRTVSRMTMHNSKIEMRIESKDITDEGQNIILRLDPSCNELELHDALETSSDIVEEHIVGRREEKEKVMSSLLEAMSEKIVILPIHGIGGIGKTTFARLICNDPKFKCYSQVWVDVSQRFCLNRIRESMISQLSRKESLANERQMIHYCLTELISHKKIMIVLDDLWEDNQFQLQELKDMLYHHDSNIIVLVTTRSELVAERICTNHQPHRILPLTNDMCWDIIEQRSGFKDRNDNEQMGIGLEIARKCGGVALAAQSLGFTLRSMNFDEWMKVKDSDIWNEPVSKDFSLPNQVLASLMLSYNYMSPCLKQCFTYCATFPKGQKIVKDDLIYQWIALDFIKPTKLLSNMQLCEKYIVQLLGLSFFQQPVSPKTSEVYYDQATFFTMHDLVHDLAISLLENKILDHSKQGNTRGSSCQYALIRDCSWPLELCLTSRARLIALRFLEGRFRSKLSGAAFAPAKSLLVLDLSECFIQRLPDSIGQLKQLRYLNSPKIQDAFLPECITQLSNLIYLNIYGSSISALPKSIGELEMLMHLDLSKCYDIHELPISFRNLEKLEYLDLSNCPWITGVSESLQCLSRLEYLNLSHCQDNGGLIRVMSSLTRVQYLNLSWVHYVGLQQALVNLTKLRYLNLKGSLYHGLVEAEVDSLLECVNSLSNLEYLNLGSNGNLRTIPESIGNLRKLNTLDISDCFRLQRLPASVSAINSLKFLHVTGCSELDKSTLPQNKDGSALLPNFVVHAGDDESSSNLSELEDKHLTLLDISRLENVKSAEEAKRIKLAEKQSLKKFELAWTSDALRFVEDKHVLRELVPPDTLEELTLKGYNSISFPSWMMSIATYLPRLIDVTLRDLPSCNVLPPLGQLPNLELLRIGGMDSIRKIDGGLYGGRRAFPRLREFYLSDMECLEEWNETYSNGEDGLNELVFPEHFELSINRCPLLRFKGCSPPGRHVHIDSSDQVLLSSWENRGHVGASSSSVTKRLSVASCEAPLHQWSLLRHLPFLKQLRITDCSDLTCSSTDLLQCTSSLKALIVEGRDRKNTTVVLPERLGELTSLTVLRVLNCNGINTLPESIRQLTCLQLLEINDCPELVQWCKSEENKMKLAHIKDIILNGKRFHVIRRRCVTWREAKLKILDGKRLRVIRRRFVTCREQKLKNKGTKEMEDSENTTMDAIGMHTDHRTRLLSRESGFWNEKDDESKYEREPSKQRRKVLELSRDFESLMAKDEKSGASGTGHDANALEDLPAHQFSLGSWIIGSTPGISRTQRRRKPAAELIHCKGGMARPCREALLAVPQTPPVVSPSTTDIGVFGSSPATHLTSLQCPALPPITPGSMYTFTAIARPHAPAPAFDGKDKG